MSSDFKPVNDRTINDVNRANQAAWGAGEFRHTDAEDGWGTNRSVAGANKTISKEGPLTKAQQAHANKYEENPRPTTPGKLNGGKALSPRQNAQLEHPQNDAVHLPRTAKKAWRKRSWE